jgi:murein DD-endopeptidase MepM/ murein hydrolase activator NlpD
VKAIGYKGGYGNYIEIRHNSVYATCYGHLSRFARGLREGTRVAQGQVIGFVGSTGLSTGPHLDFRVKRHGKFVDPLRLDSPPGRTISAEEADRFADHLGRVWRLVGLIDPGEAVQSTTAWARVTPVRPREQLPALVP